MMVNKLPLVVEPDPGIVALDDHERCHSQVVFLAPCRLEVPRHRRVVVLDIISVLLGPPGD